MAWLSLVWGNDVNLDAIGSIAGAVMTPAAVFIAARLATGTARQQRVHRIKALQRICNEIPKVFEAIRVHAGAGAADKVQSSMSELVRIERALEAMPLLDFPHRASIENYFALITKVADLCRLADAKSSDLSALEAYVTQQLPGVRALAASLGLTRRVFMS